MVMNNGNGQVRVAHLDNRQPVIADHPLWYYRRSSAGGLQHIGLFGLGEKGNVTGTCAFNGRNVSYTQGWITYDTALDHVGKDL